MSKNFGFLKLVCGVFVSLLVLISCATPEPHSTPASEHQVQPTPEDYGIQVNATIISRFQETPLRRNRIAVFETSASEPNARGRTERPIKAMLGSEGYYAISLVELVPEPLGVNDPRLYQILRDHEIEILLMVATKFVSNTHVSTDFMVMGIDLNEPNGQVMSRQSSLRGSLELRAPSDAIANAGGAENYVRHIFDLQARELAYTYTSLFAE